VKNLKYFFGLSAIFMASSVNAQQTDVDLLVDDLLILADGFAKPAAESAAYQATAGWFTSAKSLEKWKVDVSLHANAIFVPSSKKEFSVNNNQFGILKVTGNDRALLPTAFGEASDVEFESRRDLEFNGQSFSIQGLQAIDGIDKGALLYPFAQVSVGLPLNTQIGFRALPALDIDGSEFSTYGVGLKHSLSQYFGRRRTRQDDLEVAAIVAYDIFDVKYEFDPLDVPGILQLSQIDVNAGVWMAEIMASKRYESFEIFGALGAAQSDFEYEFGGSGLGLGLVNNEISRLNDSQAQFKGDIGFNLYFNSFKVSTMATAGKYVNLNVGLHFLL
tara:strand:- start:4226 stop:5221 length:996 start_codon:yes stop_codon:yes gene_type:complete